MISQLEAWFPLQLVDELAIAPIVILLLTALALFLVDSIHRDRTYSIGLAATAAIGTVTSLLVAVWFLLAGTGDDASPLFKAQLIVDEMSLFFTIIITTVTMLVIIASVDYIDGHPHQGEYYSLVLLAATGMALMSSANSLVIVFIAMELASFSSYALVSYFKFNRGSVEGGLKYFLIGALASAIFLYGISLVYVDTGTLQLQAIATAVENPDNVGLLGVGLLMIIVGLAFKTASVPFHFWAPDAYEGAPSTISAFISSASKAAGFVIAFRVLIEAFPLEIMDVIGIEWVVIIQVLAVLTMLVGNLAAAVQESVKRMLAYSSIGHAGYVLIGLAALTNPGSTNDLVLGAAMMHLFVYGFMNTGAFLFVALGEYWNIGRTFADYNGLWREAPIACTAVTVLLLSLAGLPIGGGFFSKYFLFMGAVSAGFWWLAAVGALTSAISLYYYARLVKAIWIEDAPTNREIGPRPIGIYVALVVAGFITIALLPGFFPIAEAAQSAASIVVG